MTPNESSRQLPRDVFLYLLMIFALGGSAIGLGTLLFQFVNLFVPDVAARSCDFGGCHNAIRTSLAFLVVLFPVLWATMRFLRKDLARNAVKRDLPIRRWLLYLTLFVAGLIVIGDLVTLVNGYLRGELTVRFLLKVAAVFFVAGSVFYYYLQELHQNRSARTRVLGRVVIGVTLGAIVVGFIVSGSPTRQRDVSLDRERVADLQTIQAQIVEHWRAKDRLPSALSELEDDISGFRVPVDPETGDPYEYDRIDTLTFELCATFALPSQAFESVVRPLEFGSNWEHAEGMACFERTLDPELLEIESPKPVR